MKLTKRITKLAAAALCAVLFTGTLTSFPAFAVVDNSEVGEELSDGSFTYELIDGTYTITKCDTTSILTEVPELRNGYAITAIADNAFQS